MMALFLPMAWLVPLEEGGGVFSVLTVILLVLVLAAARWLQDTVWRRWQIDLGGGVRHVAPLALCFSLGLMARRFMPESVAVPLSLGLFFAGFLGLMTGPRGG